MSLLQKIVAEASQIDEVGELVTLLRFSQLPTVIVETSNDVRIYKLWVESRLFGTYKVDVIDVGGRDNLLHLYERRSEFANVPVVFVGNQGMWVFSDIPEYYADILWTQGYSIDNDIYSNGRIRQLIQYNPTIEYDEVIEAVIKWFACEVDEYFETKVQRRTPNLDELISEGEIEINKDFLKKRGFAHPPRDSTIKDIKENYKIKLPGKLLFQMLERFSGITFDGLYNTALVNYNAVQHGIIGKIRRNLDEHGVISSKKILSKSEEKMSPEKDQKQILPANESTSKSESLVRRYTKKGTVIKGDNADILLVGRLAKKGTVVKGDNADILKELMKQSKRKFSPITSKDDLLSLYRKKQLSIYVVDQEMRVFSETPESYLNVIWTKGYSLENDLYIGGGLEDLIAPHERWKHRQVLNATIKWFAFEVEEFLGGRTLDMDVGLLDIVLPGQLDLNKKFFEENNFREPSTERIQQIKDDYERFLPGKFLLQILIRFLNTRGRSYNYKVDIQRLRDIALSASRTQQALDELAEQIKIRHDKIESKINLEKISTNPQTSSPIKVGENINGTILKKDGFEFTTQLETKNKEEILFEQNNYPIKVGKKYKFNVTSLDNSDMITKVSFIRPRTPKVGDRINAKILKNDSFKVTVRLNTDYNEVITIERPFYPVDVGEEMKFKVIAVDDTGKITRVIP